MRKFLCCLVLLLTVAAASSMTMMPPEEGVQTDAYSVTPAAQECNVQVAGKLKNSENAMLEALADAEMNEPWQVKHYYPEIPLTAELQDVLFDACDEYGIDYAVALGLIETESCFNSMAFNPASGCYGLCQLNPTYFPSGLSPADNIRHGMKYLAHQIYSYGSIEAALTAYNAGHDTGNRSYARAVLACASEWENIL